MLTIPTQDEIFQRMVQRHLEITGPMDVGEGSVSHDFLMPASMEFAEAYRYVEELYYELWVESAAGTNLDIAVSVSGIVRKLATKAKHTTPGLKITGAPKTTVPSGTRFMTEGSALCFLLPPTRRRLVQTA